MATITMQKDLVVEFKKEIILNVGTLNTINVLSPELSRLIFKDNALEKPTQNLFNHLAHYLVCIIDSVFCATMSWPLYDTKTERSYRNELSTFITEYSNRGLLSPVMSSYLVNPGCFKVVKLMFQLSQLAVHKLLKDKMKENQAILYKKIRRKYETNEKGFLEDVEMETNKTMNKFSYHIHKRQTMEKIAEILTQKTLQMEAKLKNHKAQEYIDNLVDNFLKKQPVDKETKHQLLTIKDVTKPSPFFDNWLNYTDRQICELESKWSEKFTPILNVSKRIHSNTEQLLSRFSGSADKSTYMIEYNHKTDEINTSELQSQVNSEQKFILKNIVKDEKLNFPNLIRGYVVAISFILKNADVGDEIYEFNEKLETGREMYSELVESTRDLVERITTAEARLKPSSLPLHHSSLKDIPHIPALPDLSDLRSTRELQCQVLFDPFTPLSMSKRQFNLCRKSNLKNSFAKPFSKSITTHFQPPKEDFLKSIISCRVSSYDRHNVSQHFHNKSIIHSNKVNETISECGVFTKQQLLRLVSTRKSSSSKKMKFKTERSGIPIKKRGLFNESSTSNESSGLFRCHSSPNLLEDREHRPFLKTCMRKLSIKEEDAQSPINVSGITKIDNESYNTPKLIDSFKTDRVSVPAIITPDHDKQFHEVSKDFKVDFSEVVLVLQEPSPITEVKTETPKNTEPLVKKTSSLEKIINRFKKVRANEARIETNDFKTILEEKENLTVNRVLLPDLLSPSLNVINKKPIDYLEKICLDVEEKVSRRPRESLGTALGVDETFLDQFELID